LSPLSATPHKRTTRSATCAACRTCRRLRARSTESTTCPSHVEQPLPSRSPRRWSGNAVYLGFAYDVLPEIVSKRLGCRIHHPVYAGLDVAALCVR
jgi:hypothetical protein